MNKQVHNKARSYKRTTPSGFHFMVEVMDCHRNHNKQYYFASKKAAEYFMSNIRNGKDSYHSPKNVLNIQLWILHENWKGGELKK